METVNAPISRTTHFNKDLIGDLSYAQKFQETCLWMAALHVTLYKPLKEKVMCHWDGGSNANLFMDKESFFVLQETEEKVTQVSGSKAIIKGIGIVFIRVQYNRVVYLFYMGRLNQKS